MQVKDIASLLNRYTELKMPLVISVGFTSGKTASVMVLHAEPQNECFKAITSLRDDTVMDIDARNIEFWYDVSTRKNNLISPEKAQKIYEEYISSSNREKAPDVRGGSPQHQADAGTQKGGGTEKE